MLATTALLGLGLYFWLRRSELTSTSDPMLKAWRELLRRLQRVGVNCQYSSTPGEVLRLANPQLQAESWAQLQLLVQRFLQLRYARQFDSPQITLARRVLRKRLQQFRPRPVNRTSLIFNRTST
jgi:hypothetical protein